MPLALKKPSPPSEDKRWKIVDATMRRHGHAPDALIETLHTVQECFGYLDKSALRYVAESLRVAFSQVYGVATFYHFFTLKPQGRHTCVVCTGTACYIKGASGLLAGGGRGAQSQARRDHGRRQPVAAHGALPGVVRPGPGGGVRQRGRREINAATGGGQGPGGGAAMTPEELNEIAETERGTQQQYPHRLHVCMAAGCLSSHSDRVLEALKKEVGDRGLEKSCQVKGVGCMGLCSAGPLVSVEPEGALNQGAVPEDAAEIVSHAVEGTAVPRLDCPTSAPFFQRQKKIVLENSGRIDPERIEDYIAADGYAALLEALTEMTPTGGGRAGAEQRPARPRRRRLSDRPEVEHGGKGRARSASTSSATPTRATRARSWTAACWRATRTACSKAWRSRPTPSARNQGYIYVRAEYPLAVKHLKTAIQQAERTGSAGQQHLRHHVQLPHRHPAGRRRVRVRRRDGADRLDRRQAGHAAPAPAVPGGSGLWGYPTLINNVETFANIAPDHPQRRRRGSPRSARRRARAPRSSPWPGRVENTGLIEVPMGITLREIIFDIGGGIPDGEQFKAVQTGGPSGGCIPEEYLDMPVDYESLAKVGSIMGSGGMIVMDETSCMVDVAKYFMEFCMIGIVRQVHPLPRRHARRCTSCWSRSRNGTRPRRPTWPCSKSSATWSGTPACAAWARRAPNPVLSTLRYFRDEYAAHIDDKQLPGRRLPDRSRQGGDCHDNHCSRQNTATSTA